MLEGRGSVLLPLMLCRINEVMMLFGEGESNEWFVTDDFGLENTIHI